jgi:hypothetical protein
MYVFLAHLRCKMPLLKLKIFSRNSSFPRKKKQFEKKVFVVVARILMSDKLLTDVLKKEVW